jgi:hypothetical protein
LDRRRSVLSSGDAPVTQCCRDEVLGHRVNDRGEGRSLIEERPSVGGAHRERGDNDGVGFKIGEVSRVLARYGALAWTIGRGEAILSGERGKVAWGEGIDKGRCSDGFSLARRRERGMLGGVSDVGSKQGGGGGPGRGVRQRQRMPGNGEGAA